MRYLLLSTLFVAHAAWAVTAKAGEAGELVQKTSSFEPQQKGHEISVAIDMQNYTYSEPGPDIKISGWLPGFDMTYRQPLVSPSHFVAITGSYSAGTLTYDGSISNADGNKRPASNDTQDRIMWAQASVGNVMTTLGGNELEYSAGLGARFLDDKGDSQYSYEREEKYIYLPLIVAFKKHLSSNMGLKFGVEADIFMSGTNVTHLEDVNPNYPTLNFHQDSGSGYGLFARLSKPVAWLDNNQVFGEIAYRTWSVDDSNKIALVGRDGDPLVNGQGRQMISKEPQNSTDSLNLSFGAMF